MKPEPISPKLSIILPAYNESRQILTTLRETIAVLDAKRLSFELIVVADGDDGTREIVSDFGLKESRVSVVGSSLRRGKGKAVRDGIALATGSFVGFADADNKTPLSEIVPFLKALNDGYDVVIGSRKMATSKIERPQKWYRQIGSKVFNYSVRLLFNLNDISDTQCGFKFFKKEAADKLFSGMQIDGYMFDVELLFRIKKFKYKLVELPVLWRDDADTRLQLVSGNLRNLWELGKFRLWNAR